MAKFTIFMLIFAEISKSAMTYQRILSTSAACMIFAAAAAYDEPADTTAFNPIPWAELTPGKTYLTWADADSIIPRHEVPACPVVTADTITAWRGETVGARALLYSNISSFTPLTVKLEGGEARYIRYVITDDQRRCGTHDYSLPAWTVADVIDTEGALTLTAREVRPVWCSLKVAADAPTGLQTHTLTVSDAGGHEVARATLTVNVVDRTLPPASDWKFHTDFWQQPYAASRYHGVERWSPEHFELLKPYMRELARSGQKVVSAILFYEPWGDQSHDKFDPMVATTRRADGSWAFDYDIFDRYVAMMAECGISEQINCFSMIPWDMSFRYFDEATGGWKYLQTPTGTDAYNDLWSSFLTDFAAHLREKGLFDKTCIAMDERGLPAMLDGYALLKKTVPDMKMALAGIRHPELTDKLHDYCIALYQHFTPEELEARRKAGRISTVYTCCTESEPNLLSNNNPADGALLPLIAIANGFDGYLHWSWMNWNDNPLQDTRFRLFSPGDTFLFYPGPRSSMRYERYVNGVQMAEKIRLLRLAGVDMYEIDRALEALASGRVSPEQPASALVRAVSDAIDRASVSPNLVR